MSEQVRIEVNPVIGREDLEEEFMNLRQKARANKGEHEHYVKLPARFGSGDQHLHGRVRTDGEAVHVTLQFVHQGFGRYDVNLRPPAQVNNIEVITTRRVDLNDMADIDATQFADRVLDQFNDTFKTDRYVVDMQ